MNGKSISVVNLVLVTLPVIGSLILDIDRLIGNVVRYIARYVNSSKLVSTACFAGWTWDTINSGPGDMGTRGPKDLQLLRETEMQLQAKTHGYIIAWSMQVSLA